MCYPKPGPRCSAHAEKRLASAYKDLKEVGSSEAYQKYFAARDDYLMSPKGLKELEERSRSYKISGSQRAAARQDFATFTRLRKEKLALLNIDMETVKNDPDEHTSQETQEDSPAENSGYVRSENRPAPGKLLSLASVIKKNEDAFGKPIFISSYDNLYSPTSSSNNAGIFVDYDVETDYNDEQEITIHNVEINHKEWLNSKLSISPSEQLPESTYDQFADLDEHVTPELIYVYNKGQHLTVQVDDEMIDRAEKLRDSMPNLNDRHGILNYARESGLTTAGVRPNDALADLIAKSPAPARYKNKKLVEYIRTTPTIIHNTVNGQELSLADVRTPKNMDTDFGTYDLQGVDLHDKNVGIVIKEHNKAGKPRYTLVDGFEYVNGVNSKLGLNQTSDSYKFIVVDAPSVYTNK